MIRLLLDYQWLRWLISLIAGTLVFFFFNVSVSKVHYTFISVLPGALLSLAGFIITAAAIVVSLRDQGLLKKLADKSAYAWNDLMSQFYRASRYSIIYCLFLFCFDFIPLLDADRLLSRFAYSLSIALFILVIVQLLMAIKTLEDASYISSKNASPNSRGNARETKKFNLPDDAPKRTYEEPPEPKQG